MFYPRKTQWRIIWATCLIAMTILMYGPLDDCSWNLGTLVSEYGFRLAMLTVVFGALLVWRFSGAVVVPHHKGSGSLPPHPSRHAREDNKTTTASGRFSKAWARLRYVLLLLLLCMTHGFTGREFGALDLRALHRLSLLVTFSVFFHVAGSWGEIHHPWPRSPWQIYWRTAAWMVAAFPGLVIAVAGWRASVVEGAAAIGAGVICFLVVWGFVVVVLWTLASSAWAHWRRTP
jgi:hypothetical protein